MKQEQFEKLFENFSDEMTKLVVQKGKDYTQGADDRLQNFKKLSTMLNVSPRIVWGVYCGKHWEAIMSFLNGGLESEPIKSRCLDLAVYAFLLYCISEEEVAEKPLPF